MELPVNTEETMLPRHTGEYAVSPDLTKYDKVLGRGGDKGEGGRLSQALSYRWGSRKEGVLGVDLGTWATVDRILDV